MSDPSPIHVEMYDGQTFCGVDNYDYDGVNQEDWHQHPVAPNKATCTACLDRIWQLGQKAGDRLYALSKRGAAVIWWVPVTASLRSLSLAVLHACDQEPRWMVRR